MYEYLTQTVVVFQDSGLSQIPFEISNIRTWDNICCNGRRFGTALLATLVEYGISLSSFSPQNKKASL